MDRTRIILVDAILFAQLLLTPVSAQIEFGSVLNLTTSGEVLIVEDFTSAPGLVQWPVTIMYLDLGIALGFYDENDCLYLHVGPGTIRLADVRLTHSSFGIVGSKVGPSDGDLGLDLTSFNPPYPRLVYIDLGGVIGQYDSVDAVYVKAVPPISELAAGDVRLTWADNLPPGTMVLGFDPDAGLPVRLLHPGPDFSLWSPAARGQVRFYNANGNVFSDQLSLPIYDASDRVYFDTSAPSYPPRLFGYVTVPPCNGTIGNFVWYDENCDGIQNEDESAGLPGVRVVLTGAIGSEPLENYTDATGYYQFEGLCSGDYSVDVDESTLPSHLRPTEPNVGDDSKDSDGINGGPVPVTLNDDDFHDSTIDFGYALNGTIGDRVWYDVFEDGIQDSNDFGISDIEITLYSIDGVEFNSTISDANGSYKFSNLCAGDYEVTCKWIPDFVPTKNDIGDESNDSEKSPVRVTLTYDYPRNMSIDFGGYFE